MRKIFIASLLLMILLSCKSDVEKPEMDNSPAPIFYIDEAPKKAPLPSKDKILYYNQYEDKDIDEKTGQMVDYGDKIVYSYKSDVKVNKEQNEAIEKRTSNMQIFTTGKKNEFVAKVYARPHFYQEGKDWYRIDINTTTPQEFNKIIQGRFWDNLLVKDAWANNYPSGAGDGYCLLDNSTVWDVVHDSADAQSSDYTATTIRCGPSDYGNEFIYRSFIPIDTSALPDDATITGADFKFYCTTYNNGENDGDDFLSVVQTNQANTSQLSIGDYDECGESLANGWSHAYEHDIIEGSTRLDYSGFSVNNWVTLSLNATGLSWINKTGVTKLGLREGHDLLDHDTGSTGNINQIRFSSSENTNDPYLAITYSIPSPPSEAGAQPQIWTMGDD